MSESTKARLRALQDYWQGKTHQDEVLANLPQINRLAEKQGVLHRGGISMSGDGHIIPNHDFVLEVGYGGMRDIAKQHLENDDTLTDEQKDFYQEVIITMEAALKYCKRFSALAKTEAASVSDAKRRDELLAMSDMFAHLMEGKARSFYEAVETVYQPGSGETGNRHDSAGSRDD